ncbi:MAG: histidine--tRNA ligase [bacterium]
MAVAAMSAPKHARPKGTQDFLPGAAARRRRVEHAFRHAAAAFGFEEIITPMFEHTEVFVKSAGEASDVVTKEMYTFPDRGGRSLTLRPEGTPGVVRAVLEERLRLPARLHYCGPFFRYGRPQKGRLREFHQLGVEALGEVNPEADAEVILLGRWFFEDLGIADCGVQLNSIGCRECRPAYRAELVGYLSGRAGALCEDCRVRLERNPMRVLDCKNESCRREAEGAPAARNHLCPACREHFDRLRAELDRRGLRYELADRLVRGLDYYNRTTFEYVSARLGAQDSLGGGGRYDYLFEEFGGPATPAVGLAIGLERTMMVMPEAPEPARRRLAFVVWMTEAERGAAVELLDRLRVDGVPAQMSYDPRPARQFKAADAARAACCVIIGPDEAGRGTVSLKDLATGTQEEIPRNIVAPEARALFRD